MCAHQVRPYVHLVTTDDHNHELTNRQPGDDDAPAPRYEIRVRGHLGSRWVSWFDGMNLTAEDDGTTVIQGPVVDQAALHGLLQQVRDTGLPLISVTRAAPDEATSSAAPANHPS